MPAFYALQPAGKNEVSDTCLPCNVEELCERLGVPCRIFRENVELTARKRKQSFEEAGRMVRREAFEAMCREYGGTKIATAHHQDDNAETWRGGQD